VKEGGREGGGNRKRAGGEGGGVQLVQVDERRPIQSPAAAAHQREER